MKEKNIVVVMANISSTLKLCRFSAVQMHPNPNLYSKLNHTSSTGRLSVAI